MNQNIKLLKKDDRDCIKLDSHKKMIKGDEFIAFLLFAIAISLKNRNLLGSFKLLTF